MREGAPRSLGGSEVPRLGLCWADSLDSEPVLPETEARGEAEGAVVGITTPSGKHLMGIVINRLNK